MFPIRLFLHNLYGGILQQNKELYSHTLDQRPKFLVQKLKNP